MYCTPLVKASRFWLKSSTNFNKLSAPFPLEKETPDMWPCSSFNRPNFNPTQANNLCLWQFLLGKSSFFETAILAVRTGSMVKHYDYFVPLYEFTLNKEEKILAVTRVYFQWRCAVKTKSNAKATTEVFQGLGTVCLILISEFRKTK